MTTIKARPIKLWFSFNHQEPNRREYIRRRYAPGVLTHAVVHNVAMNISDSYWHVIRDQLAKRAKQDMRRELGHVADMYRRMIIGISGKNEGPRGTLTTLAEPHGATHFAIHWPARTVSYLKAKKKNPLVGHEKWFLHKDHLLQKTMGKASTWLNAFGPISIEITKKSMDEKDAGAFPVRFNTGMGKSSERVQVATIRVKAMQKITPEMLPALSTGDINDWAEDGRHTGLIGKFPSEIAYRLAGSSRHENFVPYRHSIEPFLAFYLTRAIPTALASRIQTGLEGKIHPQG